MGITAHSYDDLGTIISHDGLDPGYSSMVMYFEKENLILAITTNSSNDKVSTFDVHTGEVIPGLVTEILPLLLSSKS